MSTLTVPLDAQLSEQIEQLVKSGHAGNKAEFARRALQHYIEAQTGTATVYSQRIAHVVEDKRWLSPFIPTSHTL